MEVQKDFLVRFIIYPVFFDWGYSPLYYTE